LGLKGLVVVDLFLIVNIAGKNMPKATLLGVKQISSIHLFLVVNVAGKTMLEATLFWTEFRCSA
jgi:hypothetical protein